MSSENEHLDEDGNLEVCGEVVEAESGQNPPVEPASPPVQPNPTPAEPFLAPYDTIQVGENELVSTTREINVFNRSLFSEGSIPLDSQDSDQLRISTKAIWSRNTKEEFFMDTPDHITVEVEEEKFNSPTAATDAPKNWSGNLKILFKNRAGEYPKILRDLNANMLQEPGYNKPNFVDTVFSAPQPFFENEMENVMFAASNTVTINAEVGYYEEKPHVPETSLTSLYRAYYNLKNPEHGPKCEIEEDSVQKFTSDSMDVMKEANELMKRSFNQYVEITINTKQGGKISEFADEFQMDKYFLELITSKHMEEVEYAEVLDETRSSVGSARDQAFPNDRYYPSVAERTSPDPLYGLIRTIKTWSQDEFENLNHNQYPLKYEYYDNLEALRFTDIIRSQIFMNKMENQVLSPNKVRSISDIFSGKKAYAETIGYKITKHNVTASTNASGEQTYEVDPEPIQEFYFMDSNKVLDIQFVDTQVNAGKSYVYRIHSINFVLGSRAYYFNHSYSSNSAENSAQIVVPIESYIHSTIVEAPYFEKFVSVLEKPPLAPQVSFVPLQGKDDEMEILLTSNFGEEFRAPIKIFESDQAIINSMIESQPQRDPVILEYQTDSLPVEFQIMRLESPPESYSDFARTDFIKTLPTVGRALMYKDEDFLPNKDYYYCFRAIDKIGISNPSQVYKVRINSYVNGIYLDIKQYEMRPLVDTSFNLSIKRALKIEPNFDQQALTFPEVEDIDTPDFATSAPEEFVIGSTPERDRVWGRDFKVRLTSKQTGKRIDINMTFKKIKKSSRPVDPTISTEETSDSTPCGSPELQLSFGTEEALQDYDPNAYGGVMEGPTTEEIIRTIEAEADRMTATVDTAVRAIPTIEAMALDLGAAASNNSTSPANQTPRAQTQRAYSASPRANTRVNTNPSRNVGY